MCGLSDEVLQMNCDRAVDGDSAAIAAFHAMVSILAWHAARSMFNCATASRYGGAPGLVIASVTNASNDFRVSDGMTKVPHW